MSEHKLPPPPGGRPHSRFSGEQEYKPFTINYAHDGTRVAVIFPQAIENLALSEEQVAEMIKSLQATVAALQQHKAAASGEPTKQ